MRMHEKFAVAIGAVLCVFGFIFLAHGQDALTSDNPPAIVITPADSMDIDSTQMLLDQMSVAETAMIDAQRNLTANKTRKQERDALLAFYQAKADYHHAQWLYYAYIHDGKSAFYAHKQETEARNRSYAYLPSEPTRTIQPVKLKLDLSAYDKQG